jgi:hypothetical protein
MKLLVIPIFNQRKGVAEVEVWINTGNLMVGDNIILLLVAGRFKTDVLHVLEELLALLKNEIVTEEEAQCSVSIFKKGFCGQKHRSNYREQHPPGVSHELGDPQQLPEPFSGNLSEEALEVL